VITPTGEIRWQQWTDSTIVNDEGEVVELQSVGRDVTEQKAAEEALLQFKGTLDQTRDCVFMFTQETLEFFYVNQGAVDQVGYTEEELFRMHPYDIKPEFPEPKFRALIKPLLDQTLPNLRFETVHRHKDGHHIPVEIFLQYIALAGEKGRFVAIVHDITERKLAEAEREKLIGELEAKNAELERFTYTVSHDLKSPLVTIKGFIGFLTQDISTGNPERIHDDIRRINKAVVRMEQLLKELLELSRIGRLVNPSENIRFEELVNDALEIVHGQLEAHRVTVHTQPDLPAVYGDRQRLTEVLQNLLDNAAKYMGDQSDPRIEIGQRGEDAERGQPIFYIRDNGIGIAPEHHERIFGLFNKLDVGSEGTGIGLAIVKRIVEFHGGRIWVESESSPQGEAGKGSTFLFTLPSKPKPDSVI
jgi:PAS domain S-box-containing protein